MCVKVYAVCGCHLERELGELADPKPRFQESLHLSQAGAKTRFDSLCAHKRNAQLASETYSYGLLYAFTDLVYNFRH